LAYSWELGVAVKEEWERRGKLGGMRREVFERSGGGEKRLQTPFGLLSLRFRLAGWGQVVGGIETKANPSVLYYLRVWQ
jgi:hypothetical protein